MTTRLPPRGEIRTDFRQHATQASEVGVSHGMNYDETTTNRTSLHSSQSGNSRRRSSGEDIRGHGRHVTLPAHNEQVFEADVAILGASNSGQPIKKTQEMNDEYYAYLWAIEGAWYKKLYFGIWGIVIAIALGIVLAYAIDSTTDQTLSLDFDNMTTEEMYQQLQRGRDLLSKKHSWNEWISLPGQLLIRGLSCLVVPMIFVNVTIGVADIYLLKKAKMVGWRMFGLCVLTSILAVAQAIILSTLLPDSMFAIKHPLSSPNNTGAVPITLMCPNKDASGQELFMSTFFDTLTNTTRMICSTNRTVISLNDTNQVFKPLVNWEKSSPTPEEVFFNLTDTLVTDNIVGAFTKDGNLISLVMFAVPLGLALATMGDENPVLDLFRQLNSIFLIMIGWVINFVPVAVVFLVASSFLVAEDPTFPVDFPVFQSKAGGDSAIFNREMLMKILPVLDVRSSSFFENFRDDFMPPLTLLVIFAVGTILHLVVVLPLVTYIASRRNPFAYMWQMKQAVNFGFGSGSSLAALPMTVKAIDNSQAVSHQLTRFLLPIGTGIHMDGASFYLAACAVFLARTQGVEMNFTRILVLLFTSVIHSWSCPPLPHGGLIALKSIWAALVSDNLQPQYFVWIVAMDVLLDRFSTVMNIMSNCLVIRIIAEQIDETYIDEQDRLNVPVLDDD